MCTYLVKFHYKKITVAGHILTLRAHFVQNCVFPQQPIKIQRQKIVTNLEENQENRSKVTAAFAVVFYCNIQLTYHCAMTCTYFAFQQINFDNSF